MGAGRSGSWWPLAAVAGVFELVVGWLGEDKVVTGTVIVVMVCVRVCLLLVVEKKDFLSLRAMD